MRETKRTNITKGAGLIALGVAFVFSAAGLVYLALTHETGPDREERVRACVNQAEALGFSTESQGGKLTLEPAIKRISPLTHVANLSALIGFCPEHELALLCAGPECDNGFEASMSYNPMSSDDGN